MTHDTNDVEFQIAFMHENLAQIGRNIRFNNAQEVTIALTELRNRALDIMKEAGIKPEIWANKHKPHDVFIGDVAFHAYVKLQSAVSAFCAAAYHNTTGSLTHAMFSLEHYVDVIAEQLVNRTPTVADGEAKAPLATKRAKKGKK